MLDASKICDMNRLYFICVVLDAIWLCDINRLCSYLHYVKYNGIIKLTGYDFHFGIMIKCDYAYNIVSVDVSYLAWWLGDSMFRLWFDNVFV